MVIFEWSSYNRYIENMDNIVDGKLIIEMLGGIQDFINFLNQITEEKCSDVDDKCSYER